MSETKRCEDSILQESGLSKLSELQDDEHIHAGGGGNSNEKLVTQWEIDQISKYDKIMRARFLTVRERELQIQKNLMNLVVFNWK